MKLEHKGNEVCYRRFQVSFHNIFIFSYPFCGKTFECMLRLSGAFGAKGAPKCC